jgi:hypothetical protein
MALGKSSFWQRQAPGDIIAMFNTLPVSTSFFFLLITVSLYLAYMIVSMIISIPTRPVNHRPVVIKANA